MAEYSYIPVQTVGEDDNILFLSGDHACKRGVISHRNGAGIFRLKSLCHGTTVYKVTFTANIAVAAGGTAGPISVAIQEDGETLGNALATVTGAIGVFENVSITTLVPVSCGCCTTISVENTSVGTAIDVSNANIVISVA